MSVALPDLLAALRASWAADTCQLWREEWNSDNPARGQCCVSSLVVRDHYGGRVLRGQTNRWTVHYWNELPDGSWLDATRDQFDEGEIIVNWTSRYPDSLWRFQETHDKYKLLSGRVKERLGL